MKESRDLVEQFGNKSRRSENIHVFKILPQVSRISWGMWKLRKKKADLRLGVKQNKKIHFLLWKKTGLQVIIC